jgi:hypothetical protein
VKVSDARDIYYTASDKASEIARNLALAGVGIVWLVAGGLKASAVTLSQDQLWALILLAASLATDLLQYLYRSLAWAIWSRTKESRLGSGAEVQGASVYLNYPTWFFFYLKMASMMAAYGFILSDLAQRLKVT